jgi:hypothetical protein
MGKQTKRKTSLYFLKSEVQCRGLRALMRSSHLDPFTPTICLSFVSVAMVLWRTFFTSLFSVCLHSAVQSARLSIHGTWSLPSPNEFEKAVCPGNVSFGHFPFIGTNRYTKFRRLVLRPTSCIPYSLGNRQRKQNFNQRVWVYCLDRDTHIWSYDVK